MLESVDVDVRHEPKKALHGGRTGLEVYRELFAQMVQRGWLVPTFMEIDPGEGVAARELVLACFPRASLEVARDYGGHERVVVVLP